MGHDYCHRHETLCYRGCPDCNSSIKEEANSAPAASPSLQEENGRLKTLVSGQEEQLEIQGNALLNRASRIRELEDRATTAETALTASEDKAEDLHDRLAIANRNISEAVKRGNGLQTALTEAKAEIERLKAEANGHENWASSMRDGLDRGRELLTEAKAENERLVEALPQKLADAFIKGATWYRKNEDFGAYLSKAACDYADYETSPITIAERGALKEVQG